MIQPAHTFLCGSPRCPRCAKIVTEREKKAAEEARTAAFVGAIEECQAFSITAQSEEAKAVALNLAVRITQRAKRK